MRQHAARFEGGFSLFDNRLGCDFRVSVMRFVILTAKCVWLTLHVEATAKPEIDFFVDPVPDLSTYEAPEERHSLVS